MILHESLFSLFSFTSLLSYFPSIGHEGLLGKQSPILFRQDRKEALRDADVVVLAGEVV